MAKIPQGLLDSVFFLFRSQDDAVDGRDPGGSGFFAKIESMTNDKARAHYYAVTCHHAAIAKPYSCLRFNTADGKCKVVETDPSEWTFEIERLGDIAVLPMTIDPVAGPTSAISLGDFLTESNVNSDEIGFGEDVFMIGLFVDPSKKEIHRKRNRAMARFGNISMMPTQEKLFPSAGYGSRDYFVLDLHSRSGYSRSPVFLFRTPHADMTFGEGGGRDEGQRPFFGHAIFRFLGMHRAQFVEELPLRESEAKCGVEVLQDGQVQHRVQGLSGLTEAVPAWDVRKLLFSDKLVWLRQEAEQKRSS